MVFKKIIFQNRYVALETPSRPPPFMANAILNFHFDFLHPSLTQRQGGLGWLCVTIHLELLHLDLLCCTCPCFLSSFYWPADISLHVATNRMLPEWRQRGGLIEYFQPSNLELASGWDEISFLPCRTLASFPVTMSLWRHLSYVV